MSAEYRGFSLKTPEQLHDQVQAAQNTGGIQLVPPSIQAEDIAYQTLLTTSPQELAERYSLRMATYTDLLQRQRTEDEDVEDLQRQYRRISALNNMDDYISNHNDPNSETTLRGRQATVFEDIRDHMERGKTKGYVTLPTGSGKTVLFAEVVESMGLRTLIVVPTLPILDQTKEKFERFAHGVEVGKVYGKEKDTNKQVTVITHDSLRIQTANGTIDPQEYDVVIVDEAHENLSPQRRKLLAEFDHAIQLGFTATPEYKEGKPEKHIESVFEEEIHSMSIREAIKEDMLCGFTIMNVKTHVDISDVQVKNGKYSPEQIEKAVNIHRRNQAPLTIYQEAFDGQSAIAFCASISHAEDVAQLFIEAGIPAAAIHSQLDRDIRKDLIAKYESGEIKVLMGVDILTRGFDAPNAQVCFNLVPTLSKVVALQRAGRVLRIDENNPDKVATIVEFDDDDSRGLQFGNLVEPGSSHAQILSDNLTDGQRQQIARTQRQLETLSIEGMEIHYELEEVLTVLAESASSTPVSEIPAGYIEFNITGLAKQLSTGDRRLKKLITAISEKLGYQYYFGKGGNSTPSYMHPEVYRMLMDEHSERNSLPEGYIKFGMVKLAGRLNISEGTLRDNIVELSDELGYEYKFTEIGRSGINYMHPYVLELLVEKFPPIAEMPDGYMKFKIVELAHSLSMFEETLKKRIAALSEELGYEYYFGKGGSKITSFMHPEVYQRILEERAESDALPEGYYRFRIATLATSLSTGQETLKDRVTAISERLGYLYKFGSGGMSSLSFMHPEVHQELLDEKNLRDVGPEGYRKVNLEELAQQLSISSHTLVKRIKDLNNIHGYDYISSKGRNGGVFIHQAVYQMLLDSHTTIDSTPE